MSGSWNYGLNYINKGISCLKQTLHDSKMIIKGDGNENMELISSMFKFLVPFLMVFFSVQIILYVVNDKFNIFTQLQKFIKKSSKENSIRIFVFIISLGLFLLIGNYITLNDFEFGILAGGYYGIVFTILPRH
ncbi:hypothetical protein [Clostridium estertheticum]|uniref:hypothetical protein n=1 Tax=Clostridium estertheticum TaxID=238834 RepID=UPI001CF36E59|nr:hypothetical protein [Clostridium estertheticum]MCB2340388.1 hypothetical protein [Clostridium estertheticum]